MFCTAQPVLPVRPLRTVLTEKVKIPCSAVPPMSAIPHCGRRSARMCGSTRESWKTKPATLSMTMAESALPCGGKKRISVHRGTGMIPASAETVRRQRNRTRFCYGRKEIPGRYIPISNVPYGANAGWRSTGTGLLRKICASGAAVFTVWQAVRIML